MHKGHDKKKTPINELRLRTLSRGCRHLPKSRLPVRVESYATGVGKGIKNKARLNAPRHASA